MSADFGCRPGRWGEAFCFEEIVDLGDASFQLVVLALCAEGKVFGDGDIGIDPMAFFKPGTVGVEHAEGGDGNIAAIDQTGNTADADQTAPGAGTDQGAESCLAEIVGKGVTTRSAPAVDQHDLGAEVARGWPLPADSVAGSPPGEGFAVEDLDKAVGDLSSAVEAFVDDQGFFIQLCGELTDQFILSVDACTTDVDITGITVGSDLYLPAVVFDPGQVAQTGFIRHRLDDEGPGAGEGW